MDNDIELGHELREFYYEVLEEGSYVTRKQVEKWLKAQDKYTRYEPVVRKHEFRQTFVDYLGG